MLEYIAQSGNLQAPSDFAIHYRLWNHGLTVDRQYLIPSMHWIYYSAYKCKPLYDAKSGTPEYS